ncbi:MAG: hypothetical protein EP347_12745 [Alphaproteobacteria bacterium]|nr:MAG: hypothetical protein EP347_12745 [Alphaproteobacteria bacterium]
MGLAGNLLRLRLKGLAPLALLGLFLGGCMSTEQAAQLGAQEHPKILKSYGGTYAEQGLDGYVAQVGGTLAAQANATEDIKARYTFTLLDSPVVNAFALPGGYVYVTRGILTLANSEAELAGVIGHEIGHVTGNHTAKRYNQQVLAGVGAMVVGAATGNSDLANVVQKGSQLYLLSYSRDQENQSDAYGVRYMRAAGYDPFEMGDFLSSMNAQQALGAKIAGQDYNPNRVDFFSTHPNSGDRAARAYQMAGKNGLTRGELPSRRDAFLNAIDGMLYGDDPAQGFVRGTKFLHSQMRIAFEAPKGYQLMNGPSAVVGQGPGGVQFQFDGANTYKQGQSLAGYISQVWGPSLKVNVQNVQNGTSHGVPMAVGRARAATSQGSVDVRLVAYQVSATEVYRMLILSPASQARSVSGDLDSLQSSFRRLSTLEAASLKPLRIKVVTVQRGDTVSSLARRMAFEDHREERFRVLNGMGATEGLQAGARVKLVVEG